MKTLSQYFLALAVGAATFSTAHADSLSGKVVDPQGAVVARAELTLFDKANSSQRQAISSATGEYSFPDIAPGTYLVEARTSEAALTMSEDITVAGATTKNLTLSVARSTVRVVVTATNSPLSEQEIAKAIDVVDLADINLRDEFALTEAIRNVPGVRVRQQEGPGGFISLLTRGMRGPDTAVLVDGMRFRDAASPSGEAAGFLPDMNIVDVSRIEVLRGAGSSLYGTNAMAGVINITSAQGGGKTRGSLRSEGGGLGMSRNTANLGGGLMSDRFVYSVGFSHLNVANGVRGEFPHRNTGAQGFAKIQLSKKMSLSGRLWGSNTTSRSSNGPSFITANFPGAGPVPAIALPEDQVELFEKGLPYAKGNATFIPSVANPDSERFATSLTGALIFSHELTPTTSYKVSYQGVGTNRRYTGFSFPGSNSYFEGRTDTLQARLDSRIWRVHLLHVGYEFERENYLNVESGVKPAPTDGRIDIDQQNHAFYGQDLIGLMQGRLQISLAGRIQTFSLRQLTIAGPGNPYTGATFENPANAYTGDVSVSYFAPSSQTKFRGHIGNSYRAPAPYERFGASYFDGFGYSFSGDPRLKPERTIAFDAGIDQWLWNSKVRLGATYFYTDLRETIEFTFSNFPQPDPFGRFGGYINSKKGGIARGMELSSQFSPTSKTNIQFNYTFTNSERRTPTIGTTFFEARGVSRHQVSATLTQWITSRFNVTMDWYWAGKNADTAFGANNRPLIFDGPNKTDFVANYKFPIHDRWTMELYGKLENAFDVRYFEAGNTTPGIWGIGGIKFNF